MSTLDLTLIWAQDLGGVIGNKGEIPWRIPEDLKRFKALTRGHAVIMGRKTWESLPGAFRPLPDRLNIVLSRKIDADFVEACHVTSVQEAMDLVAKLDSNVWRKIFVIGGEEVYKAFMDHATCIELTVVHDFYVGDARAPIVPSLVWEETNNVLVPATDKLPAYEFKTYKRCFEKK